MREWSQQLAFGLSIIAFIFALVPRDVSEITEIPLARTHPLRRVLANPFTWLIATLAIYCAVQGINSAWIYRNSGTHWWMERQSHVSWLPSGYTAPFGEMNVWRKLVIWASPALAGLAAWVGVTRRRTAVLLLTTLFLNGTAVAALGVAQKISGTREIYWTFAFPKADNFASFIYRNHGAAFIAIIAAIGTGLGWREFLRGESELRKSTPSPVFGLLACFCVIAAVFSASRTGAMLAVLMPLSITLSTIIQRRVARVWPLATFAALAAVMFGLWFGAASAEVRDRLCQLATGEGRFPIRARVYAMEVTREMFAQHRAYGVGAGGFRFLSPVYLQSFPELVQDVTLHSDGTAEVARWKLNESHSDILQFAAEFGVVGGALWAAVVAVGLGILSTRPFRRHPVTLAAVIALIGMVNYAAVDFPLHNPAVVATLVLTSVVGGRLATLEASPRERE